MNNNNFVVFESIYWPTEGRGPVLKSIIINANNIVSFENDEKTKMKFDQDNKNGLDPNHEFTKIIMNNNMCYIVVGDEKFIQNKIIRSAKQLLLG